MLLTLLALIDCVCHLGKFELILQTDFHYSFSRPRSQQLFSADFLPNPQGWLSVWYPRQVRAENRRITERVELVELEEFDGLSGRIILV
jgi:hypothetical protein